MRYEMRRASSDLRAGRTVCQKKLRPATSTAEPTSSPASAPVQIRPRHKTRSPGCGCGESTCEPHKWVDCVQNARPNGMPSLDRQRKVRFGTGSLASAGQEELASPRVPRLEEATLQHRRMTLQL
eukprot:5775147-Prymnesium_polylepis.2